MLELIFWGITSERIWADYGSSLISLSFNLEIIILFKYPLWLLLPSYESLITFSSNMDEALLFLLLLLLLVKGIDFYTGF